MKIWPSRTHAPLVPPASAPRNKRPLSALGILAALARNPVEIWSDFHFERPVLIGKTYFGDRAVVSDPAAVRRVFLDNVANYRKDAVQLRVLGPGLGNGLLTVDGEAGRRSAARSRRCSRRARSPPSRPPCTASRARRPSGSPRGLTAPSSRRRRRWRSSTLKVLEQTLFSQGLGARAERVPAGR